jgi:hypothetical protein
MLTKPIRSRTKSVASGGSSTVFFQKALKPLRTIAEGFLAAFFLKEEQRVQRKPNHT